MQRRFLKGWPHCLQVGPFSNPSETYQYYNLPFCTPKEGKEYKTEGLGEVLEGDRLVNTPFSIRFRVDKENEILCSRELTESDLKKFRKAVKKDYYFQVHSAAAPDQCHSVSAVLQVPVVAGLQYLHYSERNWSLLMHCCMHALLPSGPS